MELSSFFSVLAVIVIVGIYLSAPFTMRARAPRSRESHEVSVLKAERDRVINSLQEIDFDFKLGKIPAEDYPEQRAALLQKGAEILGKLDELASLNPTPLSSWGRGRTAAARIENAAAAKRGDSSGEAAQFSDDELESMIEARRREHKSNSAGFCPKCGKPVLATDKFCPSCGKAL